MQLIQPHLYATTGFTLFGRIVSLKVVICFHFFWGGDKCRLSPSPLPCGVIEHTPQGKPSPLPIGRQASTGGGNNLIIRNSFSIVFEK